MRIAVVGAGATGGMLAARLAAAPGTDASIVTVTVVDRGAHLEAIQRAGLRVLNPDGSETIAKPASAVETCAEAGKQDVVILAVKAHEIAALAPELRSLFHDETSVVSVQNGLPWWYFQNFNGPHAGYRVKCADPDGAIESNIETRRIIGCVIYPNGELARPGVVRHTYGDYVPVGELDGKKTERVQTLASLLTQAGFNSPVVDDIRSEVWLKLWGNLSFNPISALTHATLAEICEEPATRELAAAMMREAQVIAQGLGITFRMPLEERICASEKIGHHRTSTLLDIQAGRSVEIDVIIGALVELGELAGKPTPTIRAVYALMKLLGKRMQERRARVALLPVSS
jgi:2-dehydropantoate 2-reductase